MQRLVYTPKIECLVMLEDQQKLIDISDDIVSGSVNKRLNAMSDIQLTLQNKNGRYTKANVIQPMDRIILRMSRVGKPFLVFSGFVDDAPYYQLYPGTVTLQASDTLKLLHHTYFDPGLPTVQNWFIAHGWQYNPDTGSLFAPTGLGQDDIYGSMKDIIEAMLTEIANWPEQGISIYDLPTTFLRNIAKVMQDASQSSKAIYEQNLKILAKLYGTADIAASSSSIVGDTSGLPTTGNIDIVDVARLALKAGFAGDNAVTAVAVARAESSFNTQAMNYNTDGTYDTGLWQINSIHTAGGSGLTAPPGGVGTLNMPSDWNTVKASIASSVRTYIESQWVPTTNATSAYGIFSGAGFQFTPWSTYNNNAYKQYLSIASDAVNKAKITPDSPISVPATTNDSPQRQQAATSSAADAAAKKILQVAGSQVGVHGTGGNNYGSAIKKYQDYVGIGQGQPWCAAFASWVYGQAGVTSAKSGGVAGLEAQGQKTNNPQPADMIHWGDEHVGIVTAVNGNTVSYIAGNNSADAVGYGSATIGQATSGFNVAPTFIHFAGVGVTDSYVGTIGNQDASSFTVAQIEQLGAAGSFFTQQFQSADTTLSINLTGERALANDIPIIEWIDTAVPASGRVYCATPSGSFLAFFPDRWGFFERTPYFHINDIEIIDLTINRNDTNLTTHVFTSGPVLPDSGITIWDRMASMVASIEDEAFKYFVNVPDDFNALDFLARYGARPYVNDIMNVNNPLLLWMHGWMKFMELWSQRFTANASFTFMPELLPGGLVSFGGRVQMFLESVTHNFDMGGGFTTTAQLSSLAALSDEFNDVTNTGGQLDPVVSNERFGLNK